MELSSLEKAVEVVTSPDVTAAKMFEELGDVLTRREDLEHAVYTIKDDAKAADKVKYVAFIAAHVFKTVSKISKLSLPTKVGAQAGSIASDILTVAAEALSAYKNEPAEKLEGILKNLDAKVNNDFGGHLTDKSGKYNVDLAEIYLTYYAMFNIFTLFLMLYFAMAGDSVNKIQQKQAQEIFHAFRKFSNKFKKNTGTETAQDLNFFSPAETDADMIDQDAVIATDKRIKKEQEAKLKELQKDLKEKLATAQKIDHTSDYEGISKDEAHYLDAASQQLAEQQRQLGQWNHEAVTGNDYAAGGYLSPDEQQDKMKELMDNIRHQMKQQPSADNSKNETPMQQVAKRARKMLQEDEKRLADLRHQKIAEAKAAREKQEKKEMREVNRKLKSELKALKEQEKIYKNNDITDDRSYWSNEKPSSENIPTTHELANELRKNYERAKLERIHNELLEKRKKAADLKQKQEAEAAAKAKAHDELKAKLEKKGKKIKKTLAAAQKRKAKQARLKAKAEKAKARAAKQQAKEAAKAAQDQKKVAGRFMLEVNASNGDEKSAKKLNRQYESQYKREIKKESRRRKQHSIDLVVNKRKGNAKAKQDAEKKQQKALKELAKETKKLYKGINRQEKNRKKAERGKFKHALDHGKVVYYSRSGMTFYGISRGVYNKLNKKRRWYTLWY